MPWPPASISGLLLCVGGFLQDHLEPGELAVDNL
jgi:hypothetical protein